MITPSPRWVLRLLDPLRYAASDPDEHRPPCSFDWSAFWQTSGRRTSFTDGSLAQGYQSREFSQLFDELTDGLRDGDRLLDLACGNGAGVAGVLAAARLRGLRLSIDAVDSATVAPPSELTAAAVFHQATAERPASPENTYARVVSLFGVGYFDLSATLAAVRRLLVPGGRLAFLMAAAEGGLFYRMARRCDAYESGLKALIERPELRLDQSHIDELRELIVDRIAAPACQQEACAELDTILDGDPVAIDELQRRYAWMRAIAEPAQNFMEARQSVRIAERLGFDDVYVVPFEYKGARLGHLLHAERPTW